MSKLNEKENYIKKLENQINELLPIVEKSKNIDSLNNEIQDKNQTISFLMSQLEDLKRNSQISNIFRNYKI